MLSRSQLFKIFICLLALYPSASYPMRVPQWIRNGVFWKKAPQTEKIVQTANKSLFQAAWIPTPIKVGLGVVAATGITAAAAYYTYQRYNKSPTTTSLVPTTTSSTSKTEALPAKTPGNVDKLKATFEPMPEVEATHLNNPQPKDSKDSVEELLPDKSISGQLSIDALKIALFAAVEAGNHLQVENILASSGNMRFTLLKSQNAELDSPLHRAVAKRDIKMIGILLNGFKPVKNHAKLHTLIHGIKDKDDLSVISLANDLGYWSDIIPFLYSKLG